MRQSRTPPALQALSDPSPGKPTTVTNSKAQDALPVDASALAQPLANAAIASDGVRPQSDSLFDAVVSGAFDLEDADATVAEPRRILQAQAETPKLHKILAQSGMGSRLELSLIHI